MHLRQFFSSINFILHKNNSCERKYKFLKDSGYKRKNSLKSKTNKSKTTSNSSSFQTSNFKSIHLQASAVIPYAAMVTAYHKRRLVTTSTQTVNLFLTVFFSWKHFGDKASIGIRQHLEFHVKFFITFDQNPNFFLKLGKEIAGSNWISSRKGQN